MDNFHFTLGLVTCIGFIALLVYSIYRKAKEKRIKEDLNNKQIPNKQAESVKPEIKSTNNNYSKSYKREYLLTVNEKNQYWQLRRWADSKNLIVFTKVRLVDLISPRHNSNDNKSLFWKIQAKHVDFVICDEKINVVCIVELQDNSHNRTDRIERDKFVREVLESCGYRVIQTFSVTTDQLNRVCGYNKQETEIRHDPTDHSEWNTQD